MKEDIQEVEEKQIVNEGVHNYTTKEGYIPPVEKEVIEKLEWFKDQKLGFMIHFGIFSQFGMVESWALSDEKKDNEWSQEGIDWVEDIEEFKKQYWELFKSFNPGRLDPERFANTIKNMGFKYAVMPTKHHDGFCLWDTKYSDFKTTNPECIFSTNKYADVFGSITSAFQKINIPVGAYFSKADWNNEYYWPSDYKTSGNTHRYSGYDTTIEIEKWDKFVEFTHNQMKELISNYGPIEMLWMDAGWVNPNRNEDIKLDVIVPELRKIKKDLIFVDRTCGGKYENYVTPEQSIPDDYLDIPWESCISLGPPFAYAYNDEYKSAYKVSNIFCEILGKGGNLVLNIAPQPDGRLPFPALRVITTFSEWLEKNKDAIYGTRPFYPYFENGISYTKNKNGDKFILKPSEENTNIPKFYYLNSQLSIEKIELLGHSEKLNFSQKGSKIKIEMPPQLVDRTSPLAYVFKIKLEDNWKWKKYT
ncbi:MAG: alpha-L-fucosidase [Mycoplasmatales bacterium]